MDVKNRKILMASYHCWTSPIQVGSHQLAREFVKMGHEVAFISDPFSPFHFMPGMSHSLSTRLKLYLSGGQRYLGGKLWAYVPAAPLTPHNKPFLRSRWVARNWWKNTFPSVIQKAVKNGFGEVDLIYLESVYQYFWLGKIRHRRSVYRMTDHPEGYQKMATDSVRSLIRDMYLTVSAVAYTAKGLEPFVRSLQPYRHFYLPNGVQFDHFAGDRSGPPPEYAAIPGPRVVYAGSMEDWFDFDLVREAARSYPSFSFVLIGPEQEAVKRLSDIPNVHLLGPKRYEELPSYLRHAHVGIIPNNVWDRPELIHYMNPLKLYQYLACGLPVVASKTRELVSLKSPALLAPDRQAFIRLLGKAIEERRNVREALSFARGRDWSRMARVLLEGAGR